MFNGDPLCDKEVLLLFSVHDALVYIDVNWRVEINRQTLDDIATERVETLLGTRKYADALVKMAEELETEYEETFELHVAKSGSTATKATKKKGTDWFIVFIIVFVMAVLLLLMIM